MELRLIRLSQAARHALQGMAFLARQPGKRFRLVEDVARAKNLPRNYLSKIFQRLSRQGFLVSQRGPGGGYALAKSARRISLFDIVSSLKEPRPVQRECLLEMRGCGGQAPCFIHEAVLEAERVLREALERTSLADITSSPGG